MTSRLKWLVLTAAFVGVGADAASAVGQAPDGTSPRSATARLQNAENRSVGDAMLRQTPNGVLVTATLHDLPKGEHAFHIHAVGKCSPPFESAGGHFNPTSRLHGFENPRGPHAGDMPNLHVPNSGTVEVEVLVPGVTLEEGKPNSLFDDDGSALVVHSGPDDYMTDPAGASGSRIACGVVEHTGASASNPPVKDLVGRRPRPHQEPR